MKLFYRALTLLTALLLGAQLANAQELFDTSEPDEYFNLGVRLGLNTSVNTTSKDAGFNLRNHNSWGLGFDAGVVANINIRNYISLQPGFFFQSRSGDFTYVAEGTTTGTTRDWEVVCGHTRRYAFDIPILAVIHLNLSEDVRLNGEFGPYFSFNLKTDADATYFENVAHQQLDLRHKALDFGFKMGASLNFATHYVAGIHYLAGCGNAWKSPLMGGKNKAWTFTIGYDF